MHVDGEDIVRKPAVAVRDLADECIVVQDKDFDVENSIFGVLPEKMKMALAANQKKSYWSDGAIARADAAYADVAAVEEERRKQKLEEMQAMAEGRTAKHKKEQAKGRIDTQDFWDNTEGFNPLNGGGGGGGSFKPTCRCGWVSDRDRECVCVSLM